MKAETVRHTLLLAVTIGLAAGCGGSGAAGGSGGGGGSTPADVPTLTAIAPSAAQVGAPATTIIAYGSNFQDGATIQWNGTALPTTCVSATSISILTACTGATAVTASVPASDFAVAGSIKIEVSNPTSGGGTSNPVTFTITAAPAATIWVRKVAAVTTPQDIVWDAVHGKLYTSVGSADAVAPNTILAIDPIAGTASTPVAAGSNPNLISISSDASYLWAGLNGSNAVQRFLLPGLTKDISFSLPLDSTGNPQQAVALQAAPVSTHTVALIAGQGGNGNGVYVYDDATQRPTFVPGPGTVGHPLIDWMQWGADDSTIYGDQDNTIDEGGIATLNVTPSGVSLARYSGNQLQPSLTQFEKSNGLLYSYGASYDPVKLTQVGQFDLPKTGAEACTADSSVGRYYCVTTYSVGNTDVTNIELWVFDLNTYALLNRVYFGNLEDEAISQTNSTVTGVPEHLVRWGNAGLALTTSSDPSYGNGGIFLIDGAAVNPNAAPDATSGVSSSLYASLSAMSPLSAPTGSGEITITINGTGFSPDSTACWNCSFLQFQLLPTAYVSPTQLSVTIPSADLAAAGPLDISVFDQAANLFSTNALTFTVMPASGATQVTPLNLAGLAMAWDANSGLLYVGTADYDGAYPNSIVAVDGQSGTVVRSQTVSPDPAVLSDGANGEYLYAVYVGATNLTQFALPGLNLTATAVLNNPQNGPYLPGDMKAAPVSPHTTAVALINVGLEPQAVGGVVIFDDGVERPDFAPGWGDGQTVPALYDTLAWGLSDEILASAPGGGDGGGPLYELQVSPSGVAYLNQGTATFNSGGAEIHSDFGTGLIYSDDGNVADPSTGAILGSYNASGLLAPDSSLNRVFILGQTSAQANSSSFTIESFDEKAFTLVSSITLDNLAGDPIELVRWGTTGLAVLTSGGVPGVVESGAGMLYIVQDSTFVSNLRPANAVKAAAQELVQQRWKRLSKRDIVKMMHQRAFSQ